jgi:hypothetical protein
MSVSDTIECQRCKQSIKGGWTYLVQPDFNWIFCYPCGIEIIKRLSSAKKHWFDRKKLNSVGVRIR